MKNIRLSALALIFIALLLTSIALFTMRVQAPASSWVGYVKPSFPDYAPSGMPDFDEKQDGWGPGAGIYTWCGPVAVANSLWWLDSEYESNMTASPVPPPTISDHFPLVTAYGAWDDHDPNNVFGLVPNLAILMDTDGLQSHDGHSGTRWENLENGTRYYLKQQGLEKYFEVHDQPFPDFNWMSNQVLVCQDVELFLEFKQWTGSGWANLTSIPSLEAGHFVTCAGVNVTTSQVLISDPYQDAYEAGTAPGRSPIPHAYPHANTAVHNNASLVSQDAYNVTAYLNPPLPPPPIAPIPGYPGVVWELQGYLQTMGFGPSYHAFIRVAIATSPKAVTEWPGYIKPAFPDYAPSGMPDFDEKQDAWGPTLGTYTWCVPVAVANSLWWLDSKYESLMFANPVPPPTISDHFPLVTAYGAWDDHDPNNVAGLVANLANLMDTDGQVSHDGHVGTRWTDIQKGIQKYLMQQGVAGMFEVHNSSFPDLAWIDNETEKCQDVELCLEFWQWTGTGWTNTTITEPSLRNGHCVTCAGVNITTSQLLVSDPYQDAYEAGTVPGRSPVPHAYPHISAVHNDAKFVSQDAYTVAPFSPNPPKPPGYPDTVWELQNYLQNLFPGLPPTYHAFIREAIATSPSGVHDIAVTNVTSPKKVIFQGFTGGVNATVANNGNFPENVTLKVYANMTTIANLTMVGTLTNVSIASGNTINLTLTWDTTVFARRNYTLIACADSVPGETHMDDNNCTYGYVLVTGVGDLTGGSANPWDFVPDGVVDGSDLSIVAKCFGSWPGALPPLTWNINCDVNNDGVVDGSDLAIVAKHFGEGYP